jgi:aryl-alcohol dehydrogenase-like predicted oxidoreductase
MGREPTSSIPQRATAFEGLTVSLLGLTVVPAPIPGPSGDLAVVERLRRARAAGVTTFDVGDSHEPARSERLLRQAFPDPDPAIVVIVGRRIDDLVRREGTDGRPSDGSDGVRERLSRSLDDSRRRLAPLALRILEWSGDLVPDLAPTPPGDSPAGSPLMFRRLRPDGTGDAGADPPPGRPLFVSGALSLLDHRALPFVETAMRHRPLSFLARDPFSGGRLDGTRASMSGVDRGPGQEPPRLRDLEMEYAPVLRLAFLTERRTRTLAQSALLYAAQWPWVASVLVPLPTADRLDEVLRTFETPPLTGEEVRKARAAGPATFVPG